MRDSKAAGWERLKCQFFGDVCRRTLGPFLGIQGFDERGLTSIGGLIYRRLEAFLEISYEPETFPSYSPALILGMGAGKYDAGGRPNGVPLWYVIPDSLPRLDYSSWTFSDDPDLASVLVRIKESILEPWARPLWLDVERLKELIARFRLSAQ